MIRGLLVALHTRPRRSVGLRNNFETINLDEVLFVPLVTMLEPWQSLAVIAAASLVGERRAPTLVGEDGVQPGQLAIATAVGLAVVAWFGAQPANQPEPGAILAGMVAAWP